MVIKVEMTSRWHLFSWCRSGKAHAANLFASGGKEIGTQYALETNCIFNKNISLAIDAAWFKAGDYVKENGNGKDITYMAFKVTPKF